MSEYPIQLVESSSGEERQIIARVLVWRNEKLMFGSNDALETGLECLKRAEASSFREAQAHSHFLVGAAYGYQGNVDEAEKHLLLAHEMFESVDNESGKVASIMRMDAVWMARGVLQERLDNLIPALERARGLHNSNLVIGLLNQVGLALIEDRQADTGLACLVEANELAEEHGDYFRALITKLNLSGHLVRLFDFDTSAILCTECLDTIQRYPQYRPMEREANFILGLSEVGHGNLSRAIELLESSADVATKLLDWTSAALVRFEEGRARQQFGDRDGAIRAYSLSVKASEMLGMTEKPALSSLAQWSIESITESWTKATYDNLRKSLELTPTATTINALSVYDALSESAARLGDLESSYRFLREGITLKESFWHNVVVSRTLKTARAYHANVLLRSPERMVENRLIAGDNPEIHAVRPHA